MKDQIKKRPMASLVVTIKIMPESPEENLKKISKSVDEKIRTFAGLKDDEEIRIQEEPIAFGLKALKIMFVMNESQGSTEPLEKSLQDIKGVASVEVTDVRRTIG